MPPSRQPSWGTAVWSILRAFWRAIRRRSGRASRSWKSPRIRRLAGSEKKGWTPTPDASLPATGGQSAAPVGRIYGRRSHAYWCVVDELVAPRTVATARHDGHARRQADNPPVAPETETGATHGAEEENDGASSRPQRPVREDRA